MNQTGRFTNALRLESMFLRSEPSPVGVCAMMADVMIGIPSSTLSPTQSASTPMTRAMMSLSMRCLLIRHHPRIETAAAD